jgi:hypothetical protein
MKKLICALIILALFNSCNDSSFKKKIDLKEQIEIFQNKYNSTPDTSLQIDSKRLLFIKHEDINDQIGGEIPKFDDLNKVIILERVGNDWGEIKDTILQKGYRNTLSQFQIASIDNKEYLYYEDYKPGGSMGNSGIDFTLFDLNSNVKYYIYYYEYPSKGVWWTDFTKSRNLISHENLKSFLDEKIKKSNRIHNKPNKQELLNKRFLIENEKALIEIEKPSSINKPIKLKKISTKDEIFDIKITKAGTIATAIQNEDFILISEFKGSVLGYNRSTNEYFCVWVPNTYDWVRQMEFDSTGCLIIYDPNDQKPNYLINLYNFTYINFRPKEQIKSNSTNFFDDFFDKK